MGIETLPHYSSTSRPRGSLEEFHSEELRSLNVFAQDSKLTIEASRYSRPAKTTEQAHRRRDELGEI
jgi:hypothetical protein